MSICADLSRLGDARNARAMSPANVGASIRECMAASVHAQWSSWMHYLFSQGQNNSDGSWTMPSWAVDRWRRQMRTPYRDLPPKEQETDLKEADKILAVVIHEKHLAGEQDDEEEPDPRSRHDPCPRPVGHRSAR